MNQTALTAIKGKLICVLQNFLPGGKCRFILKILAY